MEREGRESARASALCGLAAFALRFLLAALQAF